MEIVIAVVALAILLPIVIRLVAGTLDRDRVKRYVESHGGTLIEAEWSPFGPGWFGAEHARIYRVRYLDRDGNEQEVHCKTGALSGIYFTQDGLGESSGEGPSKAQLEDENRRLREELDRSKGERG